MNFHLNLHLHLHLKLLTEQTTRIHLLTIIIQFDLNLRAKK